MDRFFAEPWKYVIGSVLGSVLTFLSKWGEAWISNWKSHKAGDRQRRIDADLATYKSAKVERVRSHLDCFVDIGIWPDWPVGTIAPSAGKLRHSILMRIETGDNGAFVHNGVEKRYKEYVRVALEAAEERISAAESTPERGGRISDLTRRRYNHARNEFLLEANRAFGPIQDAR